MPGPAILRPVPTLLLLACALRAGAAEGEEGGPAREVNALGDVSVVSDERWVEAVSRRRQRIETAPQPVVVLSADEMYDTPAVSIPERMRYLAGIDVYQSRHGQCDIGIHGYDGLTNSRTLALYDGRQFTLEEFGSTLWIGVLPLSDVAAIEIVKGPSSVTYGANAFGGVVSIQGREADERHRLYGVGGVGTFGSRDADATALGPILGQGYYKVSAGGTALGDWPGSLGSAVYQPSARTADTGDRDLLSYRCRAVAGLRLPGTGRIEADYRAFDLREMDFITDLVNGAGRASVRQEDLGGRLAGPWGEIRYDHVWSHKDYSNEKSLYDPVAYGDYHYVQAGFSDQSDTVRAQCNHALGDHFIGAGCEFMRWSSFSNLWSNQGRYQDDGTWATVATYNRAAFAEDQWSVSTAWKVTAGLRIDDHSQAGINWSPRLALNWAQNADQFWRLSWSSGYRLPTDIESHIRQYYFDSSPDLRAEHIQEFDVGWSRRLDRRINFSANGFYSRSRDEIWMEPLPAATMAGNFIAWATQGDTTKVPGPFFSFANRDIPSEMWGGTLSGDWRFEGTPIAIFANGTWQRMRYRDDLVYDSPGFVFMGNPMFRFHEELGRDIDAPPQWKANLGARYESAGPFAAVVGRCVDSRRVFSFAYSDFPTGSVVTQKIPAYAALDLSAGWNFGEAGSYRRFVRVSVLDVFDSAHYEAYLPTPAQLQLDYNRQYSSEVGRSLTIQAGWTF